MRFGTITLRKHCLILRPDAEVSTITGRISIALMILAFWRVRPVAGALLLHYIAWVSDATALAFALARRNQAIL